MATSLEVRGVSLRFGGVRALTDVGFAIRDGELFSIIGPNGAGKTSIVNCISGRYKPTEGQLFYQGRDITGLTPNARASLGIGRTFQNLALFHHMSVLDNIMVGRHHLLKNNFLTGSLYWLTGARKEELEHRRKVEEIIDFLDLQSVRKAPAGTLSYGLRKRVELARAMALQPRLILLDEPMAGMNFEEKEDMAPLHRRPQRGVRDDRGDDRARHGRGDGHLPPRHGAGFRPQDRRGRSGRRARRSPRQARLSRRRGRGAGRSRRCTAGAGERGMMDYAGRVAQADTYPKMLRLNAKEYGNEIALREKDLGLWRPFTWNDYQTRVRDFALGLVELGLGREDVIGIIGDNRPDWVAAEVAAHAIGGLSLGLYRDVLDEEASYLLNYGEAQLVFAEDEEQVDKLLTLAERVPRLKHIIYSDPRGMRKYDDPRLMSAEKLAELGRARATREPELYDRLVDATKGEDVAILCTTSGTTSHPKLAMLAAGRVLGHCATYLAFDPKGPDDEYVSVLPLPWIMEQVYVLGKGLLCRMKINFVEEPDTMMNDLREIAPTFVLFAPRVWESIAADVRAKVMDATPFKQRLFDIGMKSGLAALADGKRSGFADAILFRALRDRLGFSRLRSAATGGAALGPETFKFFQVMGVPLRTLYGQTELLGAYTLHPEGKVDPDTTGVPMADSVEIRIDNADVHGVGEIVVRHPHMFLGYYKNPEASVADIREGWMLSGDAGYFNDNKQLVVIDRIKDLAETSRGERFSPQFIENKLKFSPYIAEAVVLGAGRDALAAMICIRYSIISKWAEKNRLSFTTYSDLASRPEVYALLRKEVETVNVTLPPAQRISRFLLLYKELDADDGELTRTRKVRRSVINEKYEAIIDAIYRGDADIPVDTMIRFQDGTTQRVRTTLRVVDLGRPEHLAEAAE
ncbi:long-chain acyl-CoA synthetase [Bradyrhizobium sp. LM3.2]